MPDLPRILLPYPPQYDSQTHLPLIYLGIEGQHHLEAFSLYDGLVAIFINEGPDAFEVQGTVISDIDLPGTGRKYWFVHIDPASLRFTSAHSEDPDILSQ